MLDKLQALVFPMHLHPTAFKLNLARLKVNTSCSLLSLAKAFPIKRGISISAKQCTLLPALLNLLRHQMLQAYTLLIYRFPKY